MKKSAKISKIKKVNSKAKIVNKNNTFPITLVYEEFELTPEGEAFYKANLDHPEAKNFYKANY